MVLSLTLAFSAFNSLRRIGPMAMTELHHSKINVTVIIVWFGIVKWTEYMDGIDPVATPLYNGVAELESAFFIIIPGQAICSIER